jgi:hypothetical protein
MGERTAAVVARHRAWRRGRTYWPRPEWLAALPPGPAVLPPAARWLHPGYAKWERVPHRRLRRGCAVCGAPATHQHPRTRRWFCPRHRRGRVAA